MIDYIKINDLLIGSNIQSLLDFEIKVNQQTGEQLTNRKKSAYLRNLIFTITPGERFAKVQGSIHKFANNGERNNDRFTIGRFREVAKELSKYISPEDLINILEFGVNIETPFNPTEFLNNLIVHLNKPINKTINAGMEYTQVEYSHFILKIYNKGLQQGPSGANILRVEAKYLKMQKLFPEALKWGDLCNLETWEILGKVLRKKFSEVLFYDPSINLKSVPAKDRDIIKEGHNPIFWQDLHGPHVSRYRKRYQGLIKKYGTMFCNLPELVNQELKELVKSYHYSVEDNVRIINTHYIDLVNCSPLLYGNFSPTPLTTHENRVFCKVTGIEITVQKYGSVFLSTAGLRMLLKDNPDEFKRLRDERLSERWLSTSTDIQIREIAHSIRNEHFNPKHNATRDIKNLFSDPALFDFVPFIRQDKLIQAGLIL